MAAPAAPCPTLPGLIIQHRTAPGVIECHGFEGLEQSTRGLVLVVSANTAAAVANARALIDSLEKLLLSSSSRATKFGAPCGGRASSDRACHAHSVPNARKVLVVIADDAASLPYEPLFHWWKTAGADYTILPVVKDGVKVGDVLPIGLTAFQVARWRNSAADVIDSVIALSGTLPEDRRVFVSYRQNDARSIGEQLFEEFQKQRFDVFVDRFRIAPGYDFQEVLIDELAHKAMVVILESPTILESQWVEQELTFAKAHELGCLAVNLPGGVPVPWLDDAYRLFLSNADLHAVGSLTKNSTLTAAAVTKVTERLIAEHTASFLRRRAYLLDSLRFELAARGVTDQRLDVRGHLHVKVSTSRGPREYVVWATPRPPEIDDFRGAHTICSPGPDPAGTIVMPSTFRQARRRERNDWLARLCLVELRDAGRLAEVTDRIAAGRDV